MTIITFLLGGLAFGSGHLISGGVFAALGIAQVVARQRRRFSDQDMVKFLEDLQQRSPETYRSLVNLGLGRK